MWQITYPVEEGATEIEPVTVGLEEFLLKIRENMVEKCVYSRALSHPVIKMEEIPPIIPPSMRGDVVLNTEKVKRSSHLKKKVIPEGKLFAILDVHIINILF